MTSGHLCGIAGTMAIVTKSMTNTTDVMTIRTKSVTNMTDVVPKLSSHSAAISTTPFLPWNNPDNVITHSTFRDIEFTFNCVLDSLLWLLGVSTNVINCVVFHRQGLRDRMNFCLFSLAVIDMMYLTSNLLVDSHRFFSAFLPELSNKVNVYLLAYWSGPNIALMLTSGELTMIVALERCICVVLPMKAATLMSTRAMWAVIVFVVVLLQVAGAGTLTAKFQVRSVVDKTNGRITYFMFYTDFYAQHKLVLETVEFIFVSPILPFSTFIVVSISTAVTVVKLRLAIAWRVSTSSAGGSGRNVDRVGGGNRLTQQQVSLTKALVLVSCLYILCSVPSVALTIARLVVPGNGFYPWGRYSNMFFATHDVSYTLAAVNSSLNFFIYLWRSSRYRQTLSAWLACVNGRKSVKGPSEQTTQTLSVLG